MGRKDNPIRGERNDTLIQSWRLRSPPGVSWIGWDRIQVMDPPSTFRMAPVMYWAPGEARKATASATSSAVPKRRNEVIARGGPANWPVPGVMSVSIGAGWTAL